MAKMSKKARKYVSRKIAKIRREGKTAKQAAGKAYGMARGKGYKVPKRRKKKRS